MNKYTLLGLILCVTLPACCLRKDGCKKKDATKTGKDMGKEGTKKSAPMKKSKEAHKKAPVEEAKKSAPVKKKAAKSAPKKVTTPAMAPVTK